MAEYHYKARNSEGQQVVGVVEATTPEAAVRLLRDKKLLVISLSLSAQLFSGFGNVSKFKRVSFSDIVNFTRQLSTMVVAGLSLPEAMTILRTQTQNPTFADILADAERSIVGGGSLADALGKYPAHFSGIYIALLKAGESSGTLDKVLLRLADSLEAQREFRSKVFGALLYPAIILIGMAIVVMIMMTVVVPKLTQLYSDFNITLPLATQVLIGISNFFVNFWWLMIIVGVGGTTFFIRWRKTPVGQRMIDTILFRIPIFGELNKKIILVEFTRTLAMLISAGIHILDGMKILRNSLGNVLYRDAIDDVRKQIEKGSPLGESFAQHDIFPPLVSQMMKVGEETGKLDDTLNKVSNYFQSESEAMVKGLTTSLEPVIMVVLGVGVGFIVMAIITPIYSLTSQFQ